MTAAVSSASSAIGIIHFEIEVLTAVPGNIGTVCGIYGGEKGCCPVGKNCNSVSGCQNSDDVSCGSFCCPSGTTCDSTGGTCNKSGTDDSGNNGNSGSQCDPGYSACTLFDGCCPTGAKCVLPKNCGVPCTSDDTLCGNGCCQKGTYCTSDETCAKDNTDSFTTLVQTTRIITTQTTELTTDYPTATLDSSTTDLSSPTNFFPNGNSDSTSRSTSTTTTVPTTVTRRTIATVNAAPTMGAILGGGLGMAAGVLGALAM